MPRRQIKDLRSQRGDATRDVAPRFKTAKLLAPRFRTATVMTSPFRDRAPSDAPARHRILYVEGNTDGTVGGSYFVLYDLIRGLDHARYEPVVVFRFDNFVADNLRSQGIDVRIVPPRRPLVFERRWMNRLLSPVKKAVNLLLGFVVPSISYARFLRRERIGLVNLNNSITRNHPWMIAAWLSRTPCVTHEMGINPRYSLLSRLLGRRLDAIICVSHAIHDAMRSRGADFANITVIHNGLDTTRYELAEPPAALRRRHGIPDQAPVIGVVGNIRKWKGQETVVRATGLLSGRFPTLHCVLVGGHTDQDLDYIAHLEALAAELAIGRRLVFAGFQRNAIDYMNMMDVVVHTSIDPEPFGIVTLEAMMLAKPLVSTTIGGPAEVVVNGDSGLLVDPGKPELLAEAIASLLADPVRAAQMGKRGLERLNSSFTIDENRAKNMEVYARVLAARAS